MKNTMQNYCFSAILPNILLKKSLKHRIFRYFAIYRLQKWLFLTSLNKQSINFKKEREGSKWGIRHKTRLIGRDAYRDELLKTTRLIGRDDYRDELLKTSRLIGRNAYRVNY